MYYTIPWITLFHLWYTSRISQIIYIYITQFYILHNLCISQFHVSHYYINLTILCISLFHESHYSMITIIWILLFYVSYYSMYHTIPYTILSHVPHYPCTTLFHIPHYSMYYTIPCITLFYVLHYPMYYTIYILCRLINYIEYIET